MRDSSRPETKAIETSTARRHTARFPTNRTAVCFTGTATRRPSRVDAGTRITRCSRRYPSRSSFPCTNPTGAVCRRGRRRRDRAWRRRRRRRRKRRRLRRGLADGEIGRPTRRRDRADACTRDSLGGWLAQPSPNAATTDAAVARSPRRKTPSGEASDARSTRDRCLRLAGRIGASAERIAWASRNFRAHAPPAVGRGVQPAAGDSRRDSSSSSPSTRRSSRGIIGHGASFASPRSREQAVSSDRNRPRARCNRASTADSDRPRRSARSRYVQSSRYLSIRISESLRGNRPIASRISRDRSSRTQPVQRVALRPPRPVGRTVSACRPGARRRPPAPAPAVHERLPHRQAMQPRPELRPVAQRGLLPHGRKRHLLHDLLRRVPVPHAGEHHHAEPPARARPGPRPSRWANVPSRRPWRSVSDPSWRQDSCRRGPGLAEFFRAQMRGIPRPGAATSLPSVFPPRKIVPALPPPL